MGSTSHSEGRSNRMLGELLLDVPFALVIAIASSPVVTLGVVPIVQVLVGFPVLLFLLGYAPLFVLLPTGSSDAPTEGPSFDWFEWQPNLSLTEYLALVFGMSVMLLPVIELTLLWIGVGSDTASTLLALTAVIIVGLAVGETWRRRLPEAERFCVPICHWYVDVARSPDQPSRVDSFLNVTLVFVVIVADVNLSCALIAPGTGESYSGLSLLTQDAGGEFVAADHPEALTVGEQAPLSISVENVGDGVTSYALVAELQRVERANGEVTIVGRQVLGSRTETVEGDETWRIRHSLAPALTDGDPRLIYFLYEGNALAEPGTETACCSVYAWVTVAEEPTAGGAGGVDDDA